MRKILAIPLILFGLFAVVIGIIKFSFFPPILGVICIFQGYQYAQRNEVQVSSTSIEQEDTGPFYSKEKRSELSSHLSRLTEPKLVPVGRFFDGNINDCNSICVNLYPNHPGIPQVRKILESLEQQDCVKVVYVQVVEDIPEDGWPFSDRIIVIGDIPEEELQSTLMPLEPFEIGTPPKDLKRQVEKLLPTLDTPIKIVVWD